MRPTRGVAAVLVAALALGAGTVGAAPAQAAGLGTVTVTKVGNLLIFSPTEVTGAPGDTITVTNNSGVTILPILAGSTGTLKVGATTCDTGQATCLVTNGASLTYTLGSTGVITFESAAGDVAGPLNINAAGGGGGDPKVVYPFLTLNPNGGTCSGTLEFNAIPGTGNDSVTLPTSSTCTRSSYTLAGWAYNADGSGTVLQPGITVATGSTTLYAVWRPAGVQVTYDANVGLSTQCLAGGANVTTAANRRATSIVQPGSNSAGTAPCTPVDGRLAGWAYTGNGSVAITAGQALPATLTLGSSVTLFAQWEIVYDVTVSPSAIVIMITNPSKPATSSTVTVSATVNGRPAAGRQVDVAVTGPVTLAGVARSLVTNADGQVSVSVSSTQRGDSDLQVAFGNKSLVVQILILRN